MFQPGLKIKDVRIEAGTWIKLLRKNAGLSQQELADLLELSRMTIQKMETGHNFTIDTFLLVLQHFDQLHALQDFLASRKSEQEQLRSLY